MTYDDVGQIRFHVGIRAQKRGIKLTRPGLTIPTLAGGNDFVQTIRAQRRNQSVQVTAGVPLKSPALRTDSPLATAAPLQTLAEPTRRLPYRGMLLENTVHCNIDCIGCDRESAARIRTTKQMDLAKLSKM